ncbi:TetR/AcrR family transcriptional regulator [Mucilaginibacter sp. Bleaf8]|uniref:TetR/AcrR family transcriptional regulator n=1 Tax=Mucilaginibacter sp. Bleaf8 TaxID=2834430 RepID=UPI001BCA9F50|nr:TetR/AcrR family transcriptional regulator [Mucilaginibacter sp. Bleaf8]MBS7566422.1 TetR/AcrR family transcriptional regulator [Mucilaginibacter sp. Bleaf8]
MRPKNLEKEATLRTMALQIIAEEGLENLSMQKLAKAANVSPRTIYIKYENKEDLLIKLFIEEVLGNYEKAVLQNFNSDMDFAEGVQCLWQNAFAYLTNNRPHFALMQYGNSSPLLNKAFQQANIQQGDFFAPIHQFLEKQKAQGCIHHLPFDAQRAMLFSPLISLVSEYFDYATRDRQIITPDVLMACCNILIKGMLK